MERWTLTLGPAGAIWRCPHGTEQPAGRIEFVSMDDVRVGLGVARLPTCRHAASDQLTEGPPAPLDTAATVDAAHARLAGAAMVRAIRSANEIQVAFLAGMSAAMREVQS